MSPSDGGPKVPLRERIAPILTGPPALAFLPAATLGAYWIGGETALAATALGLPVVYALGGGYQTRSRAETPIRRNSVTGLILADDFALATEWVFEDTGETDLRSACFILELDDYRELVARHGQAAADMVVERTGQRIQSVLRDGDAVSLIGDARFAVCLCPVAQLDLELCIQLSGRMQTAVEEPVSLDGLSVYVSCSVGFCLRSRNPGSNSSDWVDAASEALREAQASGPSSIRAFSPDFRQKTKARKDLRDEVITALESGHIQPWYQPQISTDTGKITGFEALARWQHPVRGVVTPDVFLPALESAGLLERLGQVMLYHAMTALKAWDSAGADVPCVAVNFASDELRNPGLLDKLQWELDRFELTPDRLIVEILETVVTDKPDDMIAHNITGLAEMGCRIDLDDFGTGHASIASIRRFSVSRVKIDRSFVMKADRDPEQQKMIGAILTMAERLDLDTLAEGVETVGEHALLAQLGCRHVQGFGIARPMPFDQTLDWISAHQAKLNETPSIGRNAG